MRRKYSQKTHNYASKTGNAALGWLLVIALALAIIAMVFPMMRESVGDSTEQVAHEVDRTLDTTHSQIIYHPDID